MSDEAFGFTVRRLEREKDWDKDSAPLPEPRFAVYLPHSCDNWEIAGYSSGSGNADDFVTQAEAEADLVRFIDEAIIALAAIRRGDSLNCEEEDWL